MSIHVLRFLNFLGFARDITWYRFMPSATPAQCSNGNLQACYTLLQYGRNQSIAGHFSCCRYHTMLLTHLRTSFSMHWEMLVHPCLRNQITWWMCQRFVHFSFGEECQIHYVLNANVTRIITCIGVRLPLDVFRSLLFDHICCLIISLAIDFDFPTRYFMNQDETKQIVVLSKGRKL